MKNILYSIIFVVTFMAQAFGFMIDQNEIPTLYLIGNEYYNKDLAVSRLHNLYNANIIKLEAFSQKRWKELSYFNSIPYYSNYRITIGSNTYNNPNIVSLQMLQGSMPNWFYFGTDAAVGRQERSGYAQGTYYGGASNDPLDQIRLVLQDAGADYVHCNYIYKNKDIKEVKIKTPDVKKFTIFGRNEKTYKFVEIPDIVLGQLMLWYAKIDGTEFPLSSPMPLSYELKKRLGEEGVYYELEVPISAINSIPMDSPYVIYLGTIDGDVRFEVDLYNPIDSTRYSSVAVWDGDYIYPNDFLITDSNWLRAPIWSTGSDTKKAPIGVTETAKFIDAFTVAGRHTEYGGTCASCGLPTTSYEPWVSETSLTPVWVISLPSSQLLNDESWQQNGWTTLSLNNTNGDVNFTLDDNSVLSLPSGLVKLFDPKRFADDTIFNTDFVQCSNLGEIQEQFRSVNTQDGSVAVIIGPTMKCYHGPFYCGGVDGNNCPKMPPPAIPKASSVDVTNKSVRVSGDISSFTSKEISDSAVILGGDVCRLTPDPGYICKDCGAEITSHPSHEFFVPFWVLGIPEAALASDLSYDKETFFPYGMLECSSMDLNLSMQLTVQEQAWSYNDGYVKTGPLTTLSFYNGYTNFFMFNERFEVWGDYYELDVIYPGYPYEFLRDIACNITSAITRVSSHVDISGYYPVVVLGEPQEYTYQNYCSNCGITLDDDGTGYPELDISSPSDLHAGSIQFTGVIKDPAPLDYGPQYDDDSKLVTIPYNPDYKLIIYDRFNPQNIFYDTSFRAMEEGLQIRLPSASISTPSYSNMYEGLKSVYIGDNVFGAQLSAYDYAMSGKLITQTELDNIVKESYAKTLEFKVLDTNGIAIQSGQLWINKVIGISSDWGYLVPVSSAKFNAEQNAAIRPELLIYMNGTGDVFYGGYDNDKLFSEASPQHIFLRKYALLWEFFNASGEKLDKYTTRSAECYFDCLTDDFAEAPLPGQFVDIDAVDLLDGGKVTFNIVRRSNSEEQRVNDPISEYIFNTLLYDNFKSKDSSQPGLLFTDFIKTLDIGKFPYHERVRIYKNALGNPLFTEEYPTGDSSGSYSNDPTEGDQSTIIRFEWLSGYYPTYADFKNCLYEKWGEKHDWVNYLYRYGLIETYEDITNFMGIENLEPALRPYLGGLEGLMLSEMTLEEFKAYTARIEGGIRRALLTNVPVNANLLTKYSSSNATHLDGYGFEKVQRSCPYHIDCLATYLLVFPDGDGAGEGSASWTNNDFGSMYDDYLYAKMHDGGFSFYYTWIPSSAMWAGYGVTPDAEPLIYYIGCQTDGVISDGCGIYPTTKTSSVIKDFKKTYTFPLNFRNVSRAEESWKRVCMFESETLADVAKLYDKTGVASYTSFKITPGRTDDDYLPVWETFNRSSFLPIGVYTLLVAGRDHVPLYVNGFVRNLLLPIDVDGKIVLKVTNANDSSSVPSKPDRYVIQQAVDDTVIVNDMLFSTSMGYSPTAYLLEWRVFAPEDINFENPMTIEEASKEYGFSYYAPKEWSKRVYFNLMGDLSNSSGLTYQAVIKRDNKVLSYGNYWTIMISPLQEPAVSKDILAWGAMTSPSKSDLNKEWFYKEVSPNLNLNNTLDTLSWVDAEAYTIHDSYAQPLYEGKLSLVNTSDISDLSFQLDKSVSESFVARFVHPFSTDAKVIDLLDIVYDSANLTVSLDYSTLDLARMMGELSCDISPTVGMSIAKATNLSFEPKYNSVPESLDFNGKHVWYKDIEPLTLYKWVGDTVTDNDLEAVIRTMRVAPKNITIHNWSGNTSVNAGLANKPTWVVSKDHDNTVIRLEDTQTGNGVKYVTLRVNGFKNPNKEDNVYTQSGASESLTFDYLAPVMISTDGTFTWGQYKGVLKISDTLFMDEGDNYAELSTISRSGVTPLALTGSDRWKSYTNTWNNYSGKSMICNLKNIKGNISGKQYYLELTQPSHMAGLKSNIFSFWLKPSGVIMINMEDK